MAVEKREDRFKAYFGGGTNQFADGPDVWGEAKKSQGRVLGVVLSNQEDESGTSRDRGTGRNILKRLEGYLGPDQDRL